MYKIIIYKLIIFKNERGQNKRYFQKIKTIENIDIKDLSNKFIEYKTIYKDNCFVFSEIKQEEKDWYFDNLNEKSYNDYKKFIIGG